MPDPQLETTFELLENLPVPTQAVPVYARTPHGSHHFIITAVEYVRHDGEDVAVLVLREVQW